MKTSPVTSPRAPEVAKPARTKWLPEVNRLVMQVATVAEGDRQKAADDLVASMNDELRKFGLDLRVAVTSRVRAGKPNSTAAPAAVGGSAASVRRALARGESRLVQWTRDGTLIDSTTVADAWGIKRQSLDAARGRGEIFSLWVKGQHWYPAEALKFERKTFARINEALGEIDPSSKLLFLLRKHGALKGRAPADSAHDMLEKVVRLASTWAQD